MTTTPTTDINATLQQIAELTASGCDIVRVAVPEPGRRRGAAGHRRARARSRSSPTSTSSRSTSTPPSTPAARRCASTPATSASSTTRSARSPARAKDAGVSIRIGVNAGSLDKRILEKYGKATARGARRVGRLGGRASSRSTTSTTSRSRSSTTTRSSWSRAYELLAERGDWPLHLGVTEAGPAFQGTIKSATAFGALLSAGHRRHHPRLAVGPAGRGGQGRHPDPAVAQPAPAQARDRLVPVVRPRPGRRLHARRRRSPPASRA